MNNFGEFYKPSEMDYKSIVPTYQKAFMGDPWYEVSKCADMGMPRRCIGGLSRLAVGSTCEICGSTTNKPAYESDELSDRFEQLAKTRPVVWYTEQLDKGTALAALAWTATAQTIASEKYQDVPEMPDWLSTTFDNKEIIWLDEVFADKSLREKGNLRNFGKMCLGMMSRLENITMAYRTINPAMTQTATRDFGSNAIILENKVDVPDRRDFVIIRKG